jgi:hypothetical protein
MNHGAVNTNIETKEIRKVCSLTRDNTNSEQLIGTADLLTDRGRPSFIVIPVFIVAS